jgi:hypothetical protein
MIPVTYKGRVTMIDEVFIKHRDRYEELLEQGKISWEYVNDNVSKLSIGLHRYYGENAREIISLFNTLVKPDGNEIDHNIWFATIVAYFGVESIRGCNFICLTDLFYSYKIMTGDIMNSPLVGIIESNNRRGSKRILFNLIDKIEVAIKLYTGLYICLLGQGVLV